MFEVRFCAFLVGLMVIVVTLNASLFQLESDLITLKKLLHTPMQQQPQISDAFYQSTLQLIQASKDLMHAQQQLFQAIAANKYWLKVSAELQKKVQDTINAHNALVRILGQLPLATSVQEQKILKHLSGKIVIATQHKISCQYFVIKLLPQLLDNRSFVFAARIKLKSIFNAQALKEKTQTSFWQDAFEFIQVPYTSMYETIQFAIRDKQQHWLPIFNPRTIEELFSRYPHDVKSSLVIDTLTLEKQLNQYLEALSGIYFGTASERIAGQAMLDNQFKSIANMLGLCSAQNTGLAGCIAQQLAESFAAVNHAAYAIFKKV